MIGFDRPIKPSWIYETLLLAQPDQKITELNKPFEGIAKELTGKEGKRKARTVIVRCFLRSENSQARVKKDLLLKDLSLKYGYEYMVPIYLQYLVGKTNVLFRISDYLFRLYDYGVEINRVLLRDKIVDMHGDRDVVARSVRSFLKSLEHFNVVGANKKRIFLKKPLVVNEDQLRLMLYIYSKEIINSPQIAIDDLPGPIFKYYELPDLRAVAQKFNGQYWEYQQRVGSDFLVFF